MAKCNNCKNFGKKGHIGKQTTPYCFKKNEQVQNINRKIKCKYFDFKYAGGRIFKRKRSRRRRRNRRAGGGI